MNNNMIRNIIFTNPKSITRLDLCNQTGTNCKWESKDSMLSFPNSIKISK